MLAEADLVVFCSAASLQDVVRDRATRYPDPHFIDDLLSETQASTSVTRGCRAPIRTSTHRLIGSRPEWTCSAFADVCQFSQAYVIAHEIGHHVQNQLGLLPKVQQAQRGMGKVEANSLQVRVELQADCLAGVWANRGQAKWKFIEGGDVEAALQTASAIGDDRLQRQSQGYVVPDAFTHGSSAQRTRWFTTGLKGGTVSSCDTFRTEQL